MKAGLIGTGTIGRAVATGIARQGHMMTVSSRNAGHAAWLDAEFPNISVAENQTVVDAADVIFIALNTDVAPDIISQLKFRADQTIISLMGRVSQDELNTWIKPAELAAIMIPFPQIAYGGSPLMVMGDTTVVDHFFGQTDTIIALDTIDELNTFLCAQAILSPAAVLVSQAAAWVGAKTGNSEKAEVFLRRLIASSLSGMTSDDLIDALNTPGGYNQRLRQFFEEKDLHAVIHDGLDALDQSAS